MGKKGEEGGRGGRVDDDHVGGEYNELRKEGGKNAKPIRFIRTSMMGT